jgi:hypothetical protein
MIVQLVAGPLSFCYFFAVLRFAGRKQLPWSFLHVDGGYIDAKDILRTRLSANIVTSR